jgi:hypothetical protein
MSPRLRRRLARHAAAGVIITTLLAGTSAATAPPPRPSQRADLVSSAHPTPAAPSVRDDALRSLSIQLPWSRASAVATTSATCDGCDGTAVTVQVVRVTGWPMEVEVDNVATAWASCRDCSGDALSIQLVLLRRIPALTANNRALAVTARCQGCTARAAAYQVVVRSTGLPADLDRVPAELAAWAGRQPAPPRTEPGSSARTVHRQAQRRLTGLERQVTRLVGGVVLNSDATVRTD